jgi:hypothetical protein
MAIRADVKQMQDTVGDIPGIAMHQEKNGDRRKQYHETLGEFEGGNAAKRLQRVVTSLPH